MRKRKPVFATNFDTVHRLCCFKRDVQGDKSDFDKTLESPLSKAVHRFCRHELIASGLWWAPDIATLFDDGQVDIIVRTARMKDREDPRAIRFDRVSFQLCEPSEVPAVIAREKQTLNYWYIPEKG